MLVDSHTHTFYSPDGAQTTAELVRAAAAAGMDGVILTDHCDMQGWDEDHHPYDFCRDASYADILAQRAAHPDMYVGWGVELSDWMYDPAQAAAFLQDGRLDFVIGSMHTLRGIDFSYMKYESDAHCAELLHRYALDLVDHTLGGDFDSLGHLTYPLRYMRRRGFDPDFAAERDNVAEVFRALASRGKALEINSSGLRQGMGCTLPDAYWLRLYRDLGGELITLGSDAHRSQDVGANISDAAELAKSLGFGYYCVYRGRVPEHIKL